MGFKLAASILAGIVLGEGLWLYHTEALFSLRELLPLMLTAALAALCGLLGWGLEDGHD